MQEALLTVLRKDRAVGRVKIAGIFSGVAGHVLDYARLTALDSGNCVIIIFCAGVDDYGFVDCR